VYCRSIDVSKIVGTRTWQSFFGLKRERRDSGNWYLKAERNRFRC
jgi:hypothetical protein